MSITLGRAFAGGLVAVVGSLLALILGAGQVPVCLGPLGTTAVRCMAHSGVVPPEGTEVPMIAASLAAGLLIAIGWPRSRHGLIAGCIGMAVLAVVYLLQSPAVIEGPDFDGTWLRLQRPFNGWQVAWWAVVGFLAGMAAVKLAETRPGVTRAGGRPTST